MRFLRGRAIVSSDGITLIPRRLDAPDQFPELCLAPGLSPEDAQIIPKRRAYGQARQESKREKDHYLYGNPVFVNGIAWQVNAVIPYNTCPT